MGAADYADACPVCPPGIPDAALPVGPARDADGGRVADYQCGSCETAWSTFWDRWGWPIDRLIAPVSPEQAERHRAAAEAEMKQSRPVTREAAA